MKAYKMDFKTGESLTFALEAPDSDCSIGRHPMVEGVPRLDMEVEANGDPYRVRMCRPCLSEYAPKLLAEIESGVEA